MSNIKNTSLNRIKQKCIQIIDPADNSNFFVRNFWFLMAFIIPFFLMLFQFALVRVAPFGGKQILVFDAYHQYFPFFLDFQRKLQEGGSLLWSWKLGLGASYLPIITYYLASPLNILTAIIPSEYLSDFFTIITCAKIALSSLFFAQFLRIIFNRRDISVAMFGFMYAFSAYFMGYYWNIMWLDTVALLPLVVAGTITLLQKGKFKLYVISLTLSILSNCYIGLFTCIFVLLISICYFITEYKNFKNLLYNFGKMAFFSLIAIAITAILTLPTFFQLSDTSTFDSAFPEKYETNISNDNNLFGTIKALITVAANLTAFHKPTYMDGLPNVYCGIITLVLALLYFTSSNIRLREKIASGSLLMIIASSFVIRNLDFVWHGFHFTNDLPYRYAFLFSFVLLFIAYRLFTNISHIKLLNLAIISIFLLGIILGAIKLQMIIPAIATGILILLIFAVIIICRTKALPKQVISFTLFIICLFESAVSGYIGVRAVGSTDTNFYPWGTTNTYKIVDYINNIESQNSDIYHCEVVKISTSNDSALLGVNGVSIFSSTANSNILQFAKAFGFGGGVSTNSYTYQESSPFTNLMLNIKYLISPSGDHIDTTHTEFIKQSGDVKLLKNKYYLPQGFMVNEALLNFDAEKASENPFENQNEIFKLATGISGDLYQNIELDSHEFFKDDSFKITSTDKNKYSFTSSDKTKDPFVKFNYTIPCDGTAFAYFDYNSGSAYHVDSNINDSRVIENQTFSPYIMQIGDVKLGDKLSINSKPMNKKNGEFSIYCCMLNEELFLQGYEKLCQSTFNCTESSDTKIKGTINVKEDGLFYTSFAYDKGWKAYVDGKEVEITPVSNSLIAFKLAAGEHEIELKFFPKGLTEGIIIAVSAMLIFLLAIIIDKKYNIVH